MTVKVNRRAGRRRSAGKVRQLRVDYRRQTILDAARTVFTRHGFAATTVDLIAQEADIAKGTLYLYYPSKATIYSAAFISALDDVVRETMQVLGTDAPIQDVLRAFLETRWRYFERHVEFFRIYTTEQANLGRTAAQVQRESARAHEAQVEALERVLAAAVRAGELRPINARAVALVIFDLSYGVIMRRLRGVAPSAASDLEEALELLWKGLAPR